MIKSIGKEEMVSRVAALFFYLSVTLEILIVIIDKSNYINPIEGQLFRITFLLAAVKMLLTKYTVREWAAIGFFGILAFISYRMTGRNEILRIVVLIAACKGIDMRKALKFIFYLTLGGCLLLVFLSVTGIYGGLYLESDFGRGYVQRRYCLGLGHPNALHCMFFMLVLLYLYLYNRNLKWYHYGILIVLNQGLYYLTDSNTGVIVSYAVIFGAAVIRYSKRLREQKWGYFAGAAGFLFCVILSVLVANPDFAQPDQFWYRNPFVAKMESSLNGRVADLYYGSVRSEGTTPTWSLFSGPENHYFFDMGFVRIFYWYGIIPGVVWVLLNLLLVRSFYRKKDLEGVLILAVLAIYTVVEAHVVSEYLGRNYLFFIMGMYAGDLLFLKSGQEEYLIGAYRFFKK